MKTLILLFTMVTAAVYLYSQKLTVYEIKTDNYPRVTAKMLAVDSNYLNIPGIVNSDIEFYEDGAQKDLLYISCPITTKPLQISSVLTIDISSSMSLSNLNIAIKAAEEWINMLDMNNAECALTTFNSKAYLNIDFTREKSNLKYMLYNMLPINGTDYNPAFLDSFSGAISVASRGTYKPVIIFLTDGVPGNRPATDSIVKQANKYNISIYSIVIGSSCPDSLKKISSKTNGAYFENIITAEDAIEAYRTIYTITRGAKPCDISWISSGCNAQRNIEVRIPKYNLTANNSFIGPADKNPRPIFDPSDNIDFGSIEKGNDSTRKFLIKCNADSMLIKNITNTDPDIFQIIDYGGSPIPFYMYKYEKRYLQIRFKPKDTYYCTATFEIESDSCTRTKFYARGGSYTVPQWAKDFKVIHPNGGEMFVAGSQDSITWEGIFPEDSVQLEFSPDSGANWQLVEPYANRLVYKWKIPSVDSRRCQINAEQIVSFIDTGKIFAIYNDIANYVCWHPKLDLIASAARDKKIKIWSSDDFSLANNFSGFPSSINCIAWSPDGKSIAASGSDSLVYIWDFDTGAITRKFTGNSAGVSHIDYNNKGDMLLISGCNGVVKVFDVINWNIVFDSSLTKYDIRMAKWSPDDKSILAIDFFNNTFLLDYKCRTTILFPNSSSQNLGIDWQPKGYFFTVGKKVYVCNTAASPFDLPDRQSGKICNTKWSPDCTKIAGYEENSGNIFLWNAKDYKILCVVPGFGDPVTSLCWSPDSKRIITSRISGKLRIHELFGVVQDDVSDSLWTIVMPRAQASDVDMGAVLCTHYKDSVITSYITNTGSYDIAIEKIRFERKDSVNFSLVSGFPPFSLKPGESKNVEFRFSPMTEGIKEDKIYIITQVDTLIYNIKGNSVRNAVDLLSYNYDFGKIKIDNAARTIKTMLEYKGSKIIKIDSIALIGPDMRQYITTSPSIPFVLDSTNSTKELEMQFKPEHIGRAMTQIAYYFNSFASPLYSVLTGEGVLPCSSDVPDYSDFRSIDNLKFVGNASRLNNIIRLTPAAKFQAGGLWYKYALPAANGFEAKFSFRLSGGYNDFNEGSAAGADGLAFVIQSTGSYTLGENGGGIGYAGIKNCIAVEFDTYLDDLDFRDANGAHIAVFCNPKDFTKGEHQSRQLLGEKTSKYPFKALWNKYYCTIDYNLIPGKLRIFFDSTGFTNKSFLEIDSLQLENLIELIGGNSAYFGFTASTGSSYEAHDLLSFSLCVFGSKITSEVELQPDNTGSLLVSPLPASDFIKISNIPPNCYKLTVCDIFGNVIEQFDSPNQSTILIGLNGYSTGVFIIKANCGSEIVIGKAVVAR